ncbi:unnamed protein product, partial [Ostreobium quekettii]
VGLANVSAGAQRTGGSKQHPGSALDDRLAELAASITTSVGLLTTSVGFECLKEDTREVLKLTSELLRNPDLPEASIELFKSRLLNAVDHINDNISSIPARTVEQVIYGSGSIYARQPTYSGVKSITRQDAVHFLAQWQRPDAAVLGIVGDFSSPDMRRIVRDTLEGWIPAKGQPATPPVPPAYPIPQQVHAGWAFLIQQDNVEQTSVAIGELGVTLGDPDVPALAVASSILNSYGGRLFDQIRSKEGLAYSVSCQWDTPMDHPGLFLLEGSTLEPMEFLSGARSILEMATETAPTDAELERAKSEAVNSFVFNFASTGAQLNRALVYDVMGLPQDYLFRYKSAVESVTKEDVVNAAARHLHLAEQTVVMCGDVNKLKPELEKQGWRVALYQPE